VGAVDLHAAEPGLLADGRAFTEAADDVLDLGFRGFARGVEEARQVLAERHGRRRKIAGVQALGRLLARVVELHPQRSALVGGGARPLPQSRQIGFILDHHVAGLAQRTPVDHHVAGEQQPGTRGGPAPVQRDERRCGVVVVGGQRFAHGRLVQAVAQHAAVVQAQWLRQQVACRHGGG